MIGWPQNAYVGQKVVCIDASPGDYGYSSKLLQEGKIYIISKIWKNPISFQLDNVRTEYIFDYFYGRRFRPVQSTEKGMSILQKILITQKVKEKV